MLKAHNLILKFYILYALGCLIGFFFINYNGISFFSLFVILIYILGMYYGSILGEKTKSKKNYKIPIRLSWDMLLKIVAILVTISIMYTWYLFIIKYNSLSYIINNAFKIRINTIGGTEGIAPFYITYTNSLVYAAFSISLSLIGQKKLFKHKIYATYFFILVIMNDLLTFGRIGIIYSIFCFIGYILLFKKKIINKYNIIILIFLYFISTLPRLIRGSFDNFSSTVSLYEPYFRYKIPSIFNSLISNFIYYFSSPFALNEYLTNTYNSIEYTYGFRLFTPVFNIFFRIFGLDRMNTIDEFAFIPFSYNIYTFIRDIYSDFGIIGLVIVPLVIGYFFGRIFSHSSYIWNPLKIYLIGWLLYTPLYNAFSFGGFAISFIFLYLLTIVGDRDEGLKHNYSKL